MLVYVACSQENAVKSVEEQLSASKEEQQMFQERAEVADAAVSITTIIIFIYKAYFYNTTTNLHTHQIHNTCNHVWSFL